MPPIIAPHHQSAPIGSQTQLTCEKSPLSLLEPDRFQWYKRKSDEETESYTEEMTSSSTFDLKKSIGVGSTLTLNNLTKNDAGWYVCCMLTAPSTSVDTRKQALADAAETLDVDINYACSSAELVVTNLPETVRIINPTSSSKFRVILASILLVCFVVIGLMTLVLYLCHQKLKIFQRTQEAVSALQNVN